MIGRSRSTLRRYVGYKFFYAITATFVLCSLLIFLIDFIELLRQAGKYGAVSAPLLLWMTLLRLPAYTEFLLGFAVLVGSMAALLMLNRTSELSVMRAGGMSVWQFLRPGIFVTLLMGIFATAVYNPLAASSREYAEKLFAEAFSRDANLLRSKSGESWLRQDGLDGESVISAVQASNRGLTLTGVTVLTFDRKGHFAERIDAARADLENGYWKLSDAWVSVPNGEAEKYDTYVISTYLTPERVQDALGTVISVSFWELPGLIEVTEQAKLSSDRLRVQYELLRSRPLLCIAMVLLAATVSLRSFRSGGIHNMVILGMVGGLGFFLLAEVSRQIGTAGLVPPWAAVWLPVGLVIMISLTVLLHQEDG